VDLLLPDEYDDPGVGPVNDALKAGETFRHKRRRSLSKSTSLGAHGGHTDSARVVSGEAMRYSLPDNRNCSLVPGKYLD
jgi:hypothetical protein